MCLNQAASQAGGFRFTRWRFGAFIHPRILPFEAIGFGLLFIGLAIELAGSFVAERLQSKENLSLQKRVEVLRKANDELEAAAKDRTISEVQSNLFMVLTKDLPKTDIKVFVGLYDYETDRFAQQIRQLLNKAGYGLPDEKVIYQFGGRVNTTNGNSEFEFSTNALAFAFHTPNGLGDFIPLGAGFTNNPEWYALQKFWHAKEAFESIGLPGVYLHDDSNLNPGESAIIVPPKKH